MSSIQHIACPHRTVCYSGKQVGLRQLQLTFTGNSIHRARGDCSHVGEGGTFYRRSCIDAQHARKQALGWGVALVVVTHRPAAETGDAETSVHQAS